MRRTLIKLYRLHNVVRCLLNGCSVCILCRNMHKLEINHFLLIQPFIFLSVTQFYIAKYFLCSHLIFYFAFHLFSLSIWWWCQKKHFHKFFIIDLSGDNIYVKFYFFEALQRMRENYWHLLVAFADIINSYSEKLEGVLTKGHYEIINFLQQFVRMNRLTHFLLYHTIFLFIIVYAMKREKFKILIPEMIHDSSGALAF